MEVNTDTRELSLKVSFKRSLYEYFFQERDVKDLVESLAGVAHKWEEIAVAVRLPEVVRAECGEKSSPVLKLHSVLYKWIVEGHSNTKPPTVKNLKKAIEGPLVKRPDIANQLQEKYKMSSCENIAYPSIVGREDDILVQFKEDLIKQYLAKNEVPQQGVWPPLVSKTLINLALAKPKPKSGYSVAGDADEVLSMKEIVGYNELFKRFGIKDRVLILGRPGSGKTTLVHKVIKDWGHGRVLLEANLVFVIALRSLSRSDSNLSDVLSPYFFESKRLQNISSAIEKMNGRKICFILDGFDEYSSQNQNKSLIYALLQKTYLPEAMVVVTSRPAAASAHLPNRSSFKQIEVFGFSRKDIFQYIESFPFSYSITKTELITKQLKTFLKSCPGVLDLCYLPVNVAIICFLYDYDPELLPETQTEMYKHFTTSIIIRQLKQYNPSFKLHSLEDLKDEEEKLFKKLCSIAFEMMANSREVMSRGEFTADSQLSLGLVTTDISAHRSGEFQNSYSFLHLTLQEFLAAYHISKASQEKQKEVIEKYWDTVPMRNVWTFYFGLAKFEKELLVTMSNMKLFESRNLDPLFSIQCAYEAKKEGVTELVASSSIKIIDAIIGTYDISAIAYVMSEAASIHNKATSTTCLELMGGMIDSYKLAALMNHINAKAKSHLVKFKIIDYLLDSASLKLLAKELNAGFKSLQVLSLCHNGIGNDGATILAEGLKFNCSLQKFYLSSNNITTTGVTALMHCPCPLRFLDLSYNVIGDDGARNVADKLKQKSLQELNLIDCDIGVDGAEALADAIPSDVMVELKMSDTTYGLSINELRMPVNFEPSTIEHSDSRGTLSLNLSHNKRIGRECSDGIATLSKFKNLRKLNLIYNMINAQGEKVLTDYVLYSDSCHKLEDLILSGYICRTYYETDIAVKLLHHDNIKTQHKPQHTGLFNLKLNGDEVLSFAREIQLMQDFNYNQNYFSPIHIDMTDIPMDTQTAVAVLRELKNCNRVKKVEIRHTGVTNSEDTETELKKSFEHHKIKRFITMRKDEKYYTSTTVEVPKCVQ